MNTTLDYIEQLKKDKKDLVEILNSKGVEATEDETFTSLVPKGAMIGDLSQATATAGDIASGKTAYISSGLVEGTGTLESDEPMVKFTEFNSFGYPLKAFINKSYPTAGDNRIAHYLLKGDTNTSSYGRQYFYTIQQVDINPNANIQVIGSYVCSNLKSLQTVNIPSSIIKIMSNAFERCSALKTVNWHDSIKEIGSYCFDTCSNLEMSKLPSGLETLGSSAFQSCSKVTFSELPESLTITQMQASCFSSCSKITISKLPSSITSLSSYVFQKCTSITEFEFHENFTSFGTGNNFNGCTSLKVLKFKCTTPPALGNANNFTNCPLERIEVPVGCLEAYQTATNWTNYASLMVEV